MSVTLENIDFDKFLATASTEELLDALHVGLRATAAGLYRMARIIAKLQDRGVDLSPWKDTPLFRFLPAVASGALMPELLVRYGHNETFMAAFADLVPEDQEKLAAERPVFQTVVRSDRDRTGYATVWLRPHEMTAFQLRRVFGDGRIRTPAEQIRLLPPIPTAKPPPPAPPRAAPVPLPTEDAPEPETALGQAIQRSGYTPPVDPKTKRRDDLRAIGAEAWRKYPGEKARGARRDFVRITLSDSFAWSLVEHYQPRALAMAVGMLLDETAPP